MISLKNLSLRWILPGTFILFLLPMWIGFSLEHLRHEKEFLMKTAEVEALKVLYAVGHSIRDNNTSEPTKILRNTLSDIQAPENTRLVIVDVNGTVEFATEPGWKGQQLALMDGGMADGFRARENQIELVFPNFRRVAIFAPTQAVLPQSSGSQSWMILELDVTRLSDSSFQRIIRETILGGLVLIVVSLFYWFSLDRLITRPLRSMAAAMQSMSKGERLAGHAGSSSKEVIDLEAAFERMADELESRQRSEQYQRRLYAALSDTNQNIVRMTNPADLLDRTCSTAVDVGYRLVWIAGIDKVGTLRIEASAGPAAFRLEKTDGQDALIRDPLAEAIRNGHERVMRFAAETGVSQWEHEARSHGLVRGAAFPLRNRDALIGGLVVMGDRDELFSAESLDMLREMAGDVAFGLSNIKNESARSRMERRLGEERAMLRALIDSIPDIIFFKDHAHVYLGCNRAFEQLVGHKENDLLGGNEFDLFDKDQAEQYRAQDEQTIKSKEKTRYEQWVEYPDGRRVLLDTLKTPFTGPDGEVLGLIGIGRDITELRQQMEQQLSLEKQLQQAQKMEAVGQLTGGIAHDFNNILASILGFADLLQRQDSISDEKFQDYLQRIGLAARRGTDLVAQLLTFSRGGSTDDSVPLEPGPMVKETLKLLRATLPAGIQLKTNIAADLPRIVMDPVHLNQVVMNLCINARDALGEKGEISVSLSRKTGLRDTCAACGRGFDGDWVELSVADNGPGISKEHRARLFEPFYSTKPKGKGSGMGLSVVHGIQMSYGGHVLLDTKPGEGSCFQLLYPPFEADGSSVAPESLISDEAGWRVLRRKRVMVVDDEPSITVYLKEFLEMQGLQVEAYTHSPHALARLQEVAGIFDLLITDQAMPELTGLELVKQAKQLNPDLPVILCSGFSAGIDASNANEHGIDCYLDKPVTPQDLLPHMQTVMRKESDVL